MCQNTKNATELVPKADFRTQFIEQIIPIDLITVEIKLERWYAEKSEVRFICHDKSSQSSSSNQLNSQLYILIRVS